MEIKDVFSYEKNTTNGANDVFLGGKYQTKKIIAKQVKFQGVEI